MEECEGVRSAISLRIRVAFEHAWRHGGGNTDKVIELLVTKLESDDVLLALIARVSMKDVLCAVMREGLAMLSALDTPRRPECRPFDR
jgi:hypothetical protein